MLTSFQTIKLLLAAKLAEFQKSTEKYFLSKTYLELIKYTFYSSVGGKFNKCQFINRWNNMYGKQMFLCAVFSLNSALGNKYKYFLYIILYIHIGIWTFIMSQGKQQRLCNALMKEAEISVQQCSSKQQQNSTQYMKKGEK